LLTSAIDDQLSSSSGPHARAIAVREFYACGFKRLLDYGQGRSTLFALTSLKQAHGGNPDASGFGQLLLIPTNKAPSGSALCGCEHPPIWPNSLENVNLDKIG
jgi:hypothetical protein